LKKRKISDEDDDLDDFEESLSNKVREREREMFILNKVKFTVLTQKIKNGD